MTSILVISLAAAVGAFVLLWLISLPLKDASIVDPFWGASYVLVAWVAWAAADNAVQIHGGNGFALEYPVSRVLCDARILNIFEGAAEIQAEVIARRLLSEKGAN